tara:strand:+ start:1330 stop:1980 length:651 start_codon:yes stop_codon:yes gene_type:complete
MRNAILRDLGLDSNSSLVADAKQRVNDYINDSIDEVNILAKWNMLKTQGAFALATDDSIYSLPSGATTGKILNNKFYIDSNNRTIVRTASDGIFNKETLSDGTGVPEIWTPFGKDASNNDQIKVYPTPTASENGLTVTYFYTATASSLTSDASLTEFEEIIISNLAKSKYAAYDQDFTKEAKHSSTANALLKKVIAQNRGQVRFMPLTRRNHGVSE